MLPTGQRLIVPPAHVPTNREGLLWTPPLRADARTVYSNGVAAYVDPSVAETDADGSYFDSTGLLRDAILNEARIESNGFRHEGTRKNEFLQARQFDTVWTLENGLTIAQDQVGVDGVANKAWTFTDDGGVTEHLRQEVVVADDSTKWTAYIHVRKLGSAPSSFPRIVLNLVNGTLQSAQYRIDPQTGATHEHSVTGTASVNVTSVGNWWRIEITLANNGTGNTLARCNIIPADATTLTGAASAAVTGTLVIDAAQLENAAFASSFIDTTTSAVTRMVDALEYLSAGNLADNGEFSVLVAATVGFSSSSPDTHTAMDSRDDGNNNGFRLAYAGVVGKWQMSIRSGGAWQTFQTGSAQTFSIGDTLIVGITAATDDFKLYVDGVEDATDIDGVLPVNHNRIRLGNDETKDLPWFGNLAHPRIYNRALSAAEVASGTIEIQGWMP